MWQIYYYYLGVYIYIPPTCLATTSYALLGLGMYHQTRPDHINPVQAFRRTKILTCYALKCPTNGDLVMHSTYNTVLCTIGPSIWPSDHLDFISAMNYRDLIRAVLWLDFLGRLSFTFIRIKSLHHIFRQKSKKYKQTKDKKKILIIKDARKTKTIRLLKRIMHKTTKNKKPTTPMLCTYITTMRAKSSKFEDNLLHHNKIKLFSPAVENPLFYNRSFRSYHMFIVDLNHSSYRSHIIVYPCKK